MSHRKAQMVQMLDKGLLKRDNVDVETVPPDNRGTTKDTSSDVILAPITERLTDRSGQEKTKAIDLNACSELCLGFM